MSQNGVNWADVGVMTTSGINWASVADMSGSTINWDDISVMSKNGINWAGIGVFAENAETVVNQMQEVFDDIGDATDTSLTNTLFGKFTKIIEEIDSVQTDIGSVQTDINSVQTNIGTASDTSSSDTMFGRFAQVIDAVDDTGLGDLDDTINAIESIIGTSTDTSASNTVYGTLNNIDTKLGTSESETATTVFEQLQDVEDFAKKGKDSADAVLGITRDMERDLGVKGQSRTAYAMLELIRDYITDLQAEAAELKTKQDRTGGLAKQMLDLLTQSLNEQLKLAGLQDTVLAVQELQEEMYANKDVVNDKLEEINSKVEALREAMGSQDVVIKTWFESEE